MCLLFEGMVIIMLTDNEKEIIRDLYINNKFTVGQIIKVIDKPDVTESSIRHIIQRNGWSRRSIPSKFSQAEKDLILKKHLEGYNCAEIGRELGCSHKRINAFIRRQNLHSSRRKRDSLTQDEIEDIKSMYTNNCSGKEILKKYRHKISCENTILKIAKEEGCIIRNRGNIPRSLDESFFEVIDTEQKAYFLGWMLSDGYVVESRGKSSVIGIDLKRQDKYILEYFKSAIRLDEAALLLDQTRYPPKEPNSITQKQHITYQSRLIFSSKKVAADLSKYGVVPRKSHTVRFPLCISDELVRHVVRGLFDGDGCISGKIVSFSGNKTMMEDVRDILCHSIGIAYNKVTDGGTCFHFSFSSKRDVSNFYTYIYSGATIFLVRKKERFDKLDFIKQQTH